MAGGNVELGISGIDVSSLHPGDFLCAPEDPIIPSCVFNVRIVTFPSLNFPIIKGYEVLMHCHNVDEPAHVTHLISLIDKKTAEVKQKRPRAIGENQAAIVRIRTKRPVCLEMYSKFRQLGRFMLREGGRTIAAGVVEKIVKEKE